MNVLNIRLEKHYRKIALTAFLVIAASMLFYFLLFRTTTLGFVLNKIFAVKQTKKLLLLLKVVN